MERFLAEVCTPDWNLSLDAGRPFAEAVAELAARHPAQRARIEAYHARWLEMVAGPIAPTVAMLEELDARGVPLWALTNWSAETFALVRDDPTYAFLDRFRAIFVSGELRLVKPDPAIFRHALDAIGAPAGACLFIDDAAQERRRRRGARHARPTASPTPAPCGPISPASACSAGLDGRAPLAGAARARPCGLRPARRRPARSGSPSARCRSSRARSPLPGCDARSRSCATPTRSRTSRPRARPTPTSPWASCTARTGCGRWSSTAWLGQGRLAELLGEAALPPTASCARWASPRSAERAAGRPRRRRRGLLEAYAAGVNAAIARLRLRPAAGVPAAAAPPGALAAGRQPAVPEADGARPVGQLARGAVARAAGAAAAPGPAGRLSGPGEPPAPVTWPPWPACRSTAWPPPCPTRRRRASARTSGSPPAAGPRAAGRCSPTTRTCGCRCRATGIWPIWKRRGSPWSAPRCPALPFVVLGRNRDIAWGFTNTGSDTQDLFVERLDPADPGRYLTPGGSAPFQTRAETITVRGGPAETLEVRATRHGPGDLRSRPAAGALAGAGHVLALAWTQLQDSPDTTLAAGFAIGRAETAGFVAAAELYQGAQQNMAFADARRQHRHDQPGPGADPPRGRRPAAGAGLDRCLRLGRHDPGGGAAAPASTRRRAAGQRQQPAGRRRYPFFLTADWEAPLRADRIAELLGEGGPLDVERFAAVQLDQISALASDFLPYLPAADAGPAGQRDAPRGTRGWDGRCGRPAGAAAVRRLVSRARPRHRRRRARGRSRRPRPAAADFLRRALGGCDDATTSADLRRGRREHVRDRRGRARAALRPRLAGLALGRGASGRARPPAVRGQPPCATGSASCCRSAATAPRSTSPIRGDPRRHRRSAPCTRPATGRSTIWPSPTRRAGSRRPASPAIRCRGTTATSPRSGARALSADEHDRRRLSSRCDRHSAADAQRPS